MRESSPSLGGGLPLAPRPGRGPRVHDHTGLVDGLPPPGLDAATLRGHIHAAQEALLTELARAMGPLPHPIELLDLGCVRGGSPVYWAARHDAQVTAVTSVPSHVDVVRRRAQAAGLGTRVRTLLGEPREVLGRARFDAVVAVEGGRAQPRADWFRQARALLHPGGVLAVADCFQGPRTGGVDAELGEARAAGLEVEARRDLSSRVVGFWTLTSELLARESASARQGPREAQREHLSLQQGLLDGRLEYALLVLRRRD
ncbi:methyltransferase domain-containing protein [Corallococcus sp. M34]|uniref:SAM-dependent methyltransferase n=1 Tax=Citreicoccus inhibens TaxID=2849499 RepID=UPI001C22E0AD|nr:methyltransferase domain-containing protein [Citreicoccus inhibens]MBU8898482.1 methyltransferase domain-containing protein [Citreicoccus inhibens]